MLRIPQAQTTAGSTVPPLGSFSASALFDTSVEKRSVVSNSDVKMLVGIEAFPTDFEEGDDQCNAA